MKKKLVIKTYSVDELGTSQTCTTVG